MFQLRLTFLILFSPLVFADDPSEVILGERLFKEFRFSQFYSQASNGNVNKRLVQGDPQLAFLEVANSNKKLPSPFRGQAMSCASCHMVDQAQELSDLSMRMYSDYASTSPIPIRKSQHNPHTLRNSQSTLIPKSSNPELPEFFHWDGEFNSLEKLVLEGLIGRNMGWTFEEKKLGQFHILNVIRNDNGSGDLAQEFGGYSYKEILLSEDPLIEPEIRLSSEWRLNISEASSQEILNHMSRLISAYIRNIEFQKDKDKNYIGSPYDVFLRKNNLPQKPQNSETPLQYSQRLKFKVSSLKNPQFVNANDGDFETHKQQFKFGHAELNGLLMFLTVPTIGEHSPGAAACTQCHTPPTFTDAGFHNIGLSQFQYEQVHGSESFKSLDIPNLEARQANQLLYGLPNSQNPHRKQLLRSSPTIENLQKSDLGLWNFYANTDFPHLQQDLKTIIAHSLPELSSENMTDDEILTLTVGMAKTPTLRNLGHTAPYFRDGHANTLREVVLLYKSMAQGSRQGLISPIDPKIKKLHFGSHHMGDLIAFLNSLNEDYD